VWVVELAPLGNAALVPEAVSEVLQAGGVLAGMAPAQSSLEQIAAAVRDRDVLFVLDNCEHVVATCAVVIEYLLHCSPRVRIVATSREVLRCWEETPWPVPSLALPRDAADCTVEGLRSCSAVQLFVERARATVPSFDLTPDNAELVARICRRLDGIPLALELCASYIKVLSERDRRGACH
jgi:predicted ATPase